MKKFLTKTRQIGLPKKDGNKCMTSNAMHLATSLVHFAVHAAQSGLGM